MNRKVSALLTDRVHTTGNLCLRLPFLMHAAMVPLYHQWDDLLLNASFDERFTFKETKNDLNPTILAAIAIMCVGDLNQTPLTNGNNLADAR